MPGPDKITLAKLSNQSFSPVVLAGDFSAAE